MLFQSVNYSSINGYFLYLIIQIGLPCYIFFYLIINIGLPCYIFILIQIIINIGLGYNVGIYCEIKIYWNKLLFTAFKESHHFLYIKVRLSSFIFKSLHLPNILKTLIKNSYNIYFSIFLLCRPTYSVLQG